MFTLFKYLVTAAVVIAVSEIAKKSDKLGAILASFPLVTILTLFWLYMEGRSQEKIGNHAFYTFWYVLPTLPMFLVFPALLSRFGFWSALFVSCIITALCFWITALTVRLFGIELM